VPFSRGYSILQIDVLCVRYGRLLLAGRVSQFIDAFDEIFRSEGMKILKTLIRTPVANSFAERWIRHAAP
jgi:hypothetical protein